MHQLGDTNPCLTDNFAAKKGDPTCPLLIVTRNREANEPFTGAQQLRQTKVVIPPCLGPMGVCWQAGHQHTTTFGSDSRYWLRLANFPGTCHLSASRLSVTPPRIPNLALIPPRIQVIPLLASFDCQFRPDRALRPSAPQQPYNHQNLPPNAIGCIRRA